MITNFICNFEATKNLVYKAKANHGETLKFSSFILNEDKQVDLTGYTAKVLYQPTNTESSTYYEIPAKNDLSCISFEWSQQNDIGEKAYKLFLRLEKDKEVSYPGLYKLELEKSPGFQPSTNPGPIVMEFVKVGEYNTYKEKTAKKLEALDATDKANLKSSKEYTDAEVKKALGSVYKVKGSATTYTLNGLAADQKTKGDVYNVTNDGTLTLGNVKVKTGDNVVWDGTIWDALASTFDLSKYATKSWVEGKGYLENINHRNNAIEFTRESVEENALTAHSSNGVDTRIDIMQSLNSNINKDWLFDDTYGQVLSGYSPIVIDTHTSYLAIGLDQYDSLYPNEFNLKEMDKIVFNDFFDFHNDNGTVSDYAEARFAIGHNIFNYTTTPYFYISMTKKQYGYIRNACKWIFNNDYLGSNDSEAYVASKEYVDRRIGDINRVLDKINGKVI